MGSKRRIAKHILPIILADRKLGQWYIEPFVGGANMIDKVEGPRIGFDINPYLISALCMIRDGWQPPERMTEYGYKSIKNFPDKFRPWQVGYAATQMVFGARWFAGYRRDNTGSRDYAKEARNNILKQAPLLDGCFFKIGSYDEITIPAEPCIIYCDPPYQGTRQYESGSFNHTKFWQWCRDRSADGHQIFISEYKAPDDFTCIWEKEQTTTIATTEYKKATERLFILPSN